MSAWSGQVNTVLGPIEPAAMGQTMTHEHLLLDISPPELRDQPGEPITLETRAYVHRHSRANPLNLRLTSEADAIAEMHRFKRAGGGTLVEATSLGLGRDPQGLRCIAQASGVQVVMGCSYYVQAYHPPHVATMSEDEIVQEIINDITIGADGTDIRAGLIGEVGLTWPVHPDEIKVLRASVRAQRATGAPLMIHPGRDPQAPLAAMRVVEEVGGDPQRTIMAHIDRTLFSLDAMVELARTGCYLEFDLFGQESSYYALAPIDMPNDATRIDYLMRLIDVGYGEQLVIAHDICRKTALVRFGGDGYDLILRNVVPIMRRKGMLQDDIDRILSRNPARIMTFL
jgi:phosphotriesterase-related protein